MGTGTRDSNRTFKTPSNRSGKFSQQYEGVNPGHKNLGKSYAGLPNHQDMHNLVIKTFK